MACLKMDLLLVETNTVGVLPSPPLPPQNITVVCLHSASPQPRGCKTISPRPFQQIRNVSSSENTDLDQIHF